MRCLLLAVRDRLRQSPADGGLGLAVAECEITFDGKPPPMAGERFIAIWPGAWTTRNVEGWFSYYAFNVTATVRVAKVPADRTGIFALVGPTGESLEELTQKIAAKLHMDPGPRSATDLQQYPVQALANAYITQFYGASNGFVEPQYLSDGGTAEERGPEWFWAAPSKGIQPALGLSQTLRFAGAGRVQTIESQD